MVGSGQISNSSCPCYLQNEEDPIKMKTLEWPQRNIHKRKSFATVLRLHYGPCEDILMIISYVPAKINTSRRCNFELRTVG